MSTINKRKEGVDTSEELPAKNKLSRQARARKNKKQRREQIRTHHESDNIVYNPNQVYIAVNLIIYSFFMLVIRDNCQPTGVAIFAYFLYW